MDASVAEHARELVELMEQWRVTPAGLSVLAHRADEDGHWWHRHVQVVTWLGEMDSLAAAVGGHIETAWREVAPSLRAAVFVTDQPMNTNPGAGREHFSTTELAVLQSVVGAAAFAVNQRLDMTELLEMQALLAELRGFIVASDLGDQERGYLLTLCDGLNQAIPVARLSGAEGVAQLADQLIGAVAREFHDSPAKESEEAEGLVRRLADAANKVLYHPTFVAITSAAGTGVTMKAIGQ